METQFCKIGSIKTLITNKMNNENQIVHFLKTIEMKKSPIMITLLMILMSFTMQAQVGGWNPELETEAKEALSTILEKTPKLESFKNEAYGYAVFPRITKGAIAIGGAAGNGIVYKDQIAVGKTHLKQATVGMQFGGQQYVEVIFFENEETFEKFINGKIKFDAQLSAVALKAGVALDAAYQDGVAVFTATKGGLMYEASVGGQHFRYTPKN